MNNLTFTELHHGDCVGADKQSHAIGRGLRKRVVVHPPDVSKKRAYCRGDVVLAPLPYLERDEAIARSTGTLIGAVTGPEVKQRRKGEWATIRRARRLKRKIYKVYPDGHVEEEN